MTEANSHFEGAVPPSVSALLSRCAGLVPQDGFLEAAWPKNTVLLMGNFEDEDPAGLTVAESFIASAYDAHATIPEEIPLKVILSSEGGEVMQGKACISTLCDIRRDGRLVHVHVAGYAMSMAFDFLQYADHRSMEPFAWLMTHEEAWIGEGTTSQHKTEALFSEACVREALQHLSLRTGTPIEIFQANIKDGARWYMGAEEALAWGIIDEITVFPPYKLTPAQAAKAPAEKPRRPRRKKEPILI